MQTTPVQVCGPIGAVAASAWTDFTLVLTSDGSVWSWGVNDNGELGTGDETSLWVPTRQPQVSGATAVCTGEFSSLAILPDRTVRGWGSNGNGQLGVPVLNSAAIPVLIDP